MSAHAVPTFSTFGPFPDATFGGSGIPHDAVAASSKFVIDYSTAAGMQSAEVQIALTAHERFENVDVENDGLGTFEAQTGSNYGNPSDPETPIGTRARGATWNFAWYIKVEGINGSTPKINNFDVQVLYDFDPGVDTPVGELGSIDFGLAAISLSEDSQNLTFDYLENGVPGVVTPPSGVTSFDPDAIGEYTFAIVVDNNIDDGRVDVVSIDVNVVPEPAPFALAALGGIAVCSRRRG